MRISPSVVIFDYGNVLSEAQPIEDINSMASVLDLPLDRFNDLYWRFRVDYDAATLTPTAYWNAVANTGSRVLTEPQLSQLIEIDSRSWSHPAAVVPQWARELHESGIRTAILSNMPVPIRDHVVQCSWMPTFDAQIFSCDLHVCKPDARIYQECLKSLSAEPSDVLFLDDREPNIRAAEALGWQAVIFRDAGQAAREIGRQFSLPPFSQ